MTHTLRIRIAALATAVFLAALSLAGIAVRPHPVHQPQQAAQVLPAPAHDDDHEAEGD